MNKIHWFIVLALAWNVGAAQQFGDVDFSPLVSDPAFDPGSGPSVFIDEAHNNGHTADGRYRPFAYLLRQDGYVVERFDSQFTDEALQAVDVLVIANALAHPDDMLLPTESAFSDTEVEAVHSWINSGGALLLIADHMPWAGAATDLAERFGVFVHNGYAMTPGASNPLTFSQADGSLRDHAITRGRHAAEVIPFVATFGGHAFRVRSDLEASPLMVFRPQSVVYLTEQLLSGERVITRQTPHIPAEGLLQGVALQVGSGRVVMSGEAAMFSAQVAPQGQRVGMNSPNAPHNVQFTLNVVHWLSGILDD